MKKKIVSMICALSLIASMLTGCGGTSSGTADKSGKTLTVFNYSEYLDPEMLEQFTKETGIEIKYEEATTPEELYTKYKSGGIDYDLICTSDYMVKRLIDEGETQKIDFNSMNNVSNIGKEYWDISKAIDPENTYSLPYFWGTIGILYDKTKVNGPIDSWDVLFNGEYAGQFIMQDSMRDTFMITLKYLGYSLNTTDENEIREAADLLMKQKPDVEAYLVDEARDEVVAGNAAMAVVYSGEAFLGNLYNPDLEYVIPKEGSNVWIDSWVMTKNCSNTEAAQKFLDYLCRPDVAMANFEYIYYSTPNEAVVKDMDPEIKANPAVVPTPESISGCEVCTQNDPVTTELYNTLWKELKAE
ncbi:MAG: ABC transporter substrate-binding protein [Lachnospiraceae bacterium]|nr:ABC transporter substrate-binding protein [Lachnospiraceae bacterium]